MIVGNNQGSVDVLSNKLEAYNKKKDYSPSAHIFSI